MSRSDGAATAFVASTDALFGQEIPAEACPWFSARPPLVLGAKDARRSLKLLKQKCRLGLPAHLRCAIWLASVERIVNPQLPLAETDAVGTAATRPRIAATWDYALTAAFPNPADREDARPPDLGLGPDVLTRLLRHDYREWRPAAAGRSADADAGALPEPGARALARVLCTVQRVLGIEFCPPLPDVATILLTHMPESYVFAILREMINDTSHFLPVSQKDYYSWCQSFAFFVERLFPATYKAMDKCGALTPKGLAPIFKRFFVTILKREDVLRFMDIFLVEGCKGIFRMAFALLQLVKVDLECLILTDSESWWNEIRYWTLDPAFSFKKHLEKMYPKMYRKFGKRTKRYPQRKVLRRVIKHHEKWALENMPIYIDQTPPKPLGFTSDQCALAKPASVRAHLAQWLPPSLKSTQLDLIYSTEIHGRSLAALYQECRRAKNTIVLIEALTVGANATIGMFASHAWSIQPSSYGSGECFLFRAAPTPKCFHWAPDFSGSIDAMEDQATREQFMVAKEDFIAMGANGAGTHGLRLDRDLIQGESHNALGFDNEPLPGRTAFEIGVLEVYQLVREMDGKAIGHDGNLVWDTEGL